MKAKNIMLLFFFIAFWGNITSFANEELCIIVNQPPAEAPSLPWDYAQLPNWAPAEWDTIDLAIHVITGTGEPGLDSTVLSAAIAQINPAFEDAMLYFQIFTTEYHFDDDFVYVADFEAPLMFDSYRITGALNIYFVPDAGARGMAEAIPSTSCLVKNEYTDSSTLVHEIGHCLGLYHTHETMFGTENHPNTNCDVAGDVLCHTQADPNLFKGDTYHVTIDCIYIPIPGFENYTPDTHNFMSYSRNICRNRFTVDQTWGIRYSLDTKIALSALQKVPMQFTNAFQEQNIENSTLTLSSGAIINSGSYGTFNDGSTYDITTDEEKFENYYNGKDIKHHHWNEGFAEFRLTHEFTARKSDLTNRKQLAKFEVLDNSTFQMTLLHGGSNPEIAIKDPWYVINNSQPDTFHTFLAGGSELDYQVFLNQPYDDLPNPFYSVQLLTQLITVNGKSVTYDWESWSYNPAQIELQSPNSKTTAVVFKTANATLTANLKGRRTSDIPEATAGNNGRKITYHWADASTRKPYLVYEDRGNVYAASQNALGQRQKDGRIAAATGNLLNQTPAVAYLHEISGSREDKRVIAWAEYDLSEDNYLVQSSLAGFPEPDWQMPDPPHPAVSGYRLYQPAASTAVVAFHGSGALPLEGLDDGIWLWFTRDGTLYQVSGEASADYPALDNRRRQPPLALFPALRRL